MRISYWSSDVCSSDLQRRAIERHVLDKLDIRRLDVIEIAIMVEMFGIDIGDDRDRPVEPQETAVALVGLDHHPVRRAEPRVRAIRSEEHTSELQSLLRISYAVSCLKKKKVLQ